MKLTKALLCCLGIFCLASTSLGQQNTLSTKDLLSSQEFRACGLHKLTKAELAQLDRMVNIWILTAKAAGKEEARKAPQTTQRTARATALSFENLLGGYITADDGQFLGRITTSDVKSDSILNDVGRYGSDVSSTSIFNDVGKYGSDVSRLSPFNDVASKPPRVYTKDGKFVAFLTVNKVKTPRIDPHALIGWLRSQ